MAFWYIFLVVNVGSFGYNIYIGNAFWAAIDAVFTVWCLSKIIKVKDPETP